MDATTVLGTRVNEGEWPAEKGPVGHKKPQNGLRKRSTRQHHMPPWAGQKIGAGWEQPRAHEKGPVGRKKPQNRLRKRSIGYIHCSLGCIHGSHVTMPWTHPCMIESLQEAALVLQGITPIKYLGIVVAW
ncbi:hypothetical protein B0H14DRAFT_2557202 [Mycena olivaceomarginata]|nr:hypothetical protein B0H14DRAFT_2557202 [Mycena olivaceomarginata]